MERTAAKPAGDGKRGITLLAAIVVASPLLQWAYISALSHFTILEPPLTASRGLPLAMQVFFAPGSIVAVVLGVGLMRRREIVRRVALVVFLIGLGFSAWVVGSQVVASRFDSNVLLGSWSLVLSAVCLWYFARASVREAFQPRKEVRREAGNPASPADAPGTSVDYPREMTAAAGVEFALGVAAMLLVAYLHAVFNGRPLLDVGPGIGVIEADDLLRTMIFVGIALLLAPHVLTTLASAGILLGRETTALARRYAVMACWTVIGCALVTAWLATHALFAFDVLSARLLFAFCGISLAWHAVFLWLLARFRSTNR